MNDVAEAPTLQDQLAQALRRIGELEGQIAELQRRCKMLELSRSRPLELPVPPWKHLVARPHPWRRQLFIRGRNMVVRHVMGTMAANGLTPEQTAADLDLPVEAVYEAIAYFHQNEALIQAEVEEERKHLEERGYLREPQPVPR